ncbi:MAG: DUF2889 domain-containing protein [Candidatus Nanopelagicales bacterium]|nr:DUF2889 domain-containing protein [Candidatus Nanopelagicales bacterium]
MPEQRIPHHRRSVVFDVYPADDACLEVVGRLRDERPWAQRPEDLPLVHDLELRATVSTTDFTVRAVEATFHTYPHSECPAIAGAYQQLVGVQVGRGWTTAMRERLGGPKGCTHLRELARAMAPVLVQAAFSARVHENPTRDGDQERLRMVLPFLSGTCHVWAPGGPGEQKLDAGWVPGTTTYPVPPVADFAAE